MAPGLIITGLVIYWLAISLDLDRVFVALRQANYLWIMAAVLAVLLTLWTRTLRWRILLDSPQVTFSGTLQALIGGQLLNLILPARLGDLGRAYLITREGYSSQAQALGTVALEKLWDILLLVGLVIALSWWYPLPGWVAIPARLTAIGGGILLMGIIGLLYFRTYLTARGSAIDRGVEAIITHCPYPERILGIGRAAGKLLDGVGGVRRPRIMLTAGAWSFVAWLFGGLTNLAVLEAFNLPRSPGLAFFLLAVLQLGVAVPSLPARIGVFEGLCVFTLTLFGIEPHLALGYGLMLHLVVLLPPVLLGMWGGLRLDITSRRVIS